MEIVMSNSWSKAINRHPRQQESGFSLLEMVIAIFILTIGLLGVASSIGYSMVVSNSGRGLTNAKLLVVSALEQMETLRDSGQLNFAEISNSQVLGSSFTGFPTDFLPVSKSPGPDFVHGTLDDPGIADPSLAFDGVTRRIEIQDLSPTLKQIRVTLKYSPNGRSTPMPSDVCDRTLGQTDRETRCLVCVSYLNDDSHGNYVP